MDSWEYPQPQRRFTERFGLTLAFVGLAFILLLAFPIYWIVKSHYPLMGHPPYAVDLKALSNFDFDEHNGTVSDIPQRDRDLDGKEVSLEGFIAPTSVSEDKLKAFELIYNVARNDWDRPRVQERVFAQVSHGTIDFSTDEIRVIGILHIKLNKDPDIHKIVTVFTLDVERVEPL
jgi:hypothetical protein